MPYFSKSLNGCRCLLLPVSTLTRALGRVCRVTLARKISLRSGPWSTRTVVVEVPHEIPRFYYTHEVVYVPLFSFRGTKWKCVCVNV